MERGAGHSLKYAHRAAGTFLTIEDLILRAAFFVSFFPGNLSVQ
jgi:hypothetical protein